MIIRSQNKKAIVNLNKVYGIYIVVKRNGEIKENYETDIRCSEGEKETEGILGTYSTEEKAIKVLDMICTKYYEPIYQNKIEENEVAVYQGKVFQMPQDSEV